VSRSKLQDAYQLLRELVEDTSIEQSPEEAKWYAPPLPPIDPGSQLSATDLLSWWFRPPTASAGSWDAYFGTNLPRKGELEPGAPSPPESSSPARESADPVRRAVFRALLAEDEDGLGAEEADSALEVFYEFLHAFGRRDVEGAMRYVAEDYHTFDDDREMNHRDLANSLEALLASLLGWDFTVTLAMVPELLRHPYGIVIYAEIQLDAVERATGAKRNLVEQRLVLMEQGSDKSWKLAAFSRPRG
jgi:ketosteroid isomerase-like protein